MDTGTEQLLCAVDDGIALVTFNNPTKRYALSREIREALPGTLRALQRDSDVRVVVLTGAGDKAFVSGADISEFGEQRTTPDARAAYDERAADAARAWHELDKPIIAMIRGFCIGGGLLTALQADIRIASDDSRFGVPAARLGLGYGFGGVEQLVQLVGPAWASDILFSARRLDAGEALQCGLINRVATVGSLREEVWTLASSIRDNAPLTVASLKVALREARRAPDRRDLARVAAMVEACFQSEDYREGQAAFLEKRPPEFRGT
ncbi:MAG: enoyl-CoA hydratase [Actinomycetota bacterium]|nr:enoyl-CoA hydratase [Actinomycetota bacterium]